MNQPAEDSPRAEARPAPGPADRPSDADSRRLVARITESVARRSPAFQGAWEKLEERYRRRLLRYAERQIGPALRRRFEAEDVVNEAWGRAFRDIDHFVYKGPLSFFHWLKRQVWRVVADAARKNDRRDEPRREADFSGSQAGFDPAAETAGPASRAASDEIKAVLQETLDELPSLYRDVLRSFYIEGLSREETARKYDRLPNTITHQLKRGVALWRAAIDRRHGGGSFERWFGAP